MMEKEEGIDIYRFENHFEAGEYSDIPNGEYDLVIEKKVNGKSKFVLFEIKHADSARDNQCKHLQNEDLLLEVCGDGEIVFRGVLYQGKPFEVKSEVSFLNDSIQYVNVADFLEQIHRDGLSFLFNAKDGDDHHERIQLSLSM